VLKGNYRLAPDFRYPSALEDVLGVYQALLDMKIPAKRVVFVGHSAGATLALSAVIQLASWESRCSRKSSRFQQSRTSRIPAHP
jgi:acetyl esterase/lipase